MKTLNLFTITSLPCFMNKRFPSLLIFTVLYPEHFFFLLILREATFVKVIKNYPEMDGDLNISDTQLIPHSPISDFSAFYLSRYSFTSWISRFKKRDQIYEYGFIEATFYLRVNEIIRFGNEISKLFL